MADCSDFKTFAEEKKKNVSIVRAANIVPFKARLDQLVLR